MATDSESLGKASLWTSIVCIAVPVILGILALVFIENRDNRDKAYVLCASLGGVLELIALGLGIATRSTATGKAGMIISGILVLVAALATVRFVFF